MSYKFYEKDRETDYRPQYAHLFNIVSGAWYMVPSGASTEVYKSTDSGASWETGVVERTYNIKVSFPDNDEDKIYYVTEDYQHSNIISSYVFELDCSDDSVTELGSWEYADSTTYRTQDIFKIGTGLFVQQSKWDHLNADYGTRILEWITGTTWTEKDWLCFLE